MKLFWGSDNKTNSEMSPKSAKGTNSTTNSTGYKRDTRDSGYCSTKPNHTHYSEDEKNGNIQATPEMCIHCFEVLIQKLRTSKPSFSDSSNIKNNNISNDHSPPPYVDSLPSPSTSCSLFITWTKQRNHSNSSFKNNTDNIHTNNHPQYDLRGCIGSLQPKKLITAIPEYALISAFSDRRFQPITLDEINDLQVSVSLLVQYEDCGMGMESCYDWEVGVHGIIIRFVVSNTTRNGFFGERSTSTKKYNATFLPEVAKEQGWTQKETIRALIKKAGYNREIDNDILQSIHLTRYQSSKCCITYDDYLLLSNNGGNS